VTGGFAMKKLFRLLGVLLALVLELPISPYAHAQWIEGDSISIGGVPGVQGRDPMNGEPGSWFAWHTNDVSWSLDYDGYLTARNGGWTSAAVSSRMYDSSSNPTVNFRLGFRRYQTSYILGFTPTPPGTTNFHSSNVTLGLYLHANTATIRPSWSPNDTGWNATVPNGVVDIRIAILMDEGKVRFQLQHVASFDDTLSTFTNPDWSVEVDRPIEDRYFVQINPYNQFDRVYDVWAAPEPAVPFLYPIDGIVVREGGPVVIAPRTEYAGDLPLQYGIDDPRYAQADSVFTWQTDVGDAGIYHPVVTVTNGYSTDSAMANVTVLSAPALYAISDIVVREGDAVIIAARTEYAGDLPLQYGISDPRYAQEDSVFTWQTDVGDAGVYHPVVTVTDGFFPDSVTVNVTVMWELDPPGWTGNGTPVCTATGVQAGAQIVSDGYGGTIIAWIDRRSGNADVYAQRLDADGMPLWAPNGVPVCTAAADQSDVQIVSDGDHGAYVVWRSGSTNLLAQRLDSDGNPRWAINGVAVGYGHMYENWFGSSRIALGSDGSLLTAYIEKWISNSVIWGLVGLTSFSPAGAFRFESTFGNVLEALMYVDIAADPFGGAVLCYGNDYFGGNYSAIWRVDGGGSIRWSGTFKPGVPHVASDGVGGAIVCVAGESGTKDIWAQRFTPTGQAAWTSGGIPICTASGSQSIIGLESSGADRFTVAWLDTRSGSNEIYAQSVDTAGTTFWQADGARINASHGVQGASCMAPDGAGGAFIAWSDGPLFIQHITSMGAQLWEAGADTLRSGVCGTGSLVLARAEECGVVAAWNDDRNGEMDIFANAKPTVPCNHPPVLVAIGHKRVDVGVELSIQLAASDPDAGAVLIYGTNAGSALPSAFSFDANTGLFSWTPVSGDAGDYSVTFSVTDGVYEDSETIIIGVFEHGTRPPVIEPIADVTIFAGATALLEAHASDPDGDALVYSISDARFTQNDSIFYWQTAADDAGTYHLIVSVTDGHLSDSTTVAVRVLQPPPYTAYHDPMTGLPGSPFEWSEKGIVWCPEEEGYLSGTAPAGWSYPGRAVVSARSLNSSADSQVVFRVRFIQGSTTYIFGFTATPPSVTDFHRDKVDLGLYLRLEGGLRPSWSINSTPGTWTFTVPSGVVDVRITLHKGRQTVGFDLKNVASYSDPLSTFLAPDWSAEMPRPVGDTYYVQINPYNTAAKVYDVWLGAPCGDVVLQSIDDVIVWEEMYAGQQPLVITAHATCRCGCELRYWMNDPRFVQETDGVFSWMMEEGATGEYHPVVYATDGISIDSVTVNVTVLRTCRCVLRGYGASMATATDGSFPWHEQGVVWNTGENGYLSGAPPASWYSGVVSGASFPAAPQRSLIVRFLRSSATNIKAGFTFTPPRSTDFDSRKIDFGVHIDSTGSIRPTGPADNPEVWKTGLHEGVYDLKIEIDKSTSTVKRSLVRVLGYQDPLPDFSTVVWSNQETRTIADSCWIQINPYIGAAKVYDVFSSPLIRVDVVSSSAAADKGGVRVTWTLAEGSNDVQFFVSREENGDGVFDELLGISIEKDSLTYSFSDNTCRPNTSYRYLVEASYPTGRTPLFYQSIKTPPLPFKLLQNTPNPFTTLTTIGYDVPGEDRVTIDVYNVLGQRVMRLVNARKTGGRHTIDWNGNDAHGRPASSGIYFYRIEWAGQTLSRKMILLR